MLPREPTAGTAGELCNYPPPGDAGRKIAPAINDMKLACSQKESAAIAKQIAAVVPGYNRGPFGIAAFFSYIGLKYKCILGPSKTE
jgi:hypothetical protein